MTTHEIFNSTTRHDMFVELATDKINQIEQMIREDEYDDLHRWLHPIMLVNLQLELADLNDVDLQSFYCDQLGVDIPEVPPLSSNDGQEKDTDEVLSQAEEKESRSMSGTSGVDSSTLSSVYSISDEKGVAEMAAALRSIACREKALHRIEPSTEVRISVRLLLRLVYGEGCIC
jgi:hypothetical protein